MCTLIRSAAQPTRPNMYAVRFLPVDGGTTLHSPPLSDSQDCMFQGDIETPAATKLDGRLADRRARGCVETPPQDRPESHAH